MSVLLTAAKKHGKHDKKHKPIKPPAQRAAPKNGSAGQSSSQAHVQSGPPLSTPSVSVWYWLLDAAPMTVMFDKSKKEIWCNGIVVQAFEAFDETDEGVDAGGDNLEFTIFCPQTQRSHQAQLRSVPNSTRPSNLSSSMQNNQYIGSHWMTVDGCYIPEYTDQQIHVQGVGAEDDYDFDDYADDDTQPPAYGAAVYGGDKKYM